MKRLIFSLLAAACLAASSVAPGWAQSPGGQYAYPPAPNPAMPASPLAGGMPAMAGGQYVDASGRPIVLPASYCQDAGCYGGCPDGSGCGDGMYADFGGYSMPDQVGPHYFDVSAEAVFLQPEDLFNNVPSFSTIGAGNSDNLLPAPGDLLSKYFTGWRIALRYDLGPLSVLEATYTGVYDINGTQTTTAANSDLFSVFTDYGNDATGGRYPFDEFDNADIHRLRYASDLQNTEFNYRRYWVGANPRISGTYLAGFRYVRMTEDFSFFGSGLNGSGTVSLASQNDMLGAHFGGDAWLGLRQGLRIGIDGKSGIFNNHYSLSKVGSFTNTTDFATSARGDQVAFVGDARALLVADILPSWSLRGGYEVLYLNSLAAVGGNLNVADPAATAVYTQAHALYHGFTAGFEYIW